MAIKSPNATTELVRRITDTSTEPLIGRIIGREDEDRVIVAWGDSRHQADADGTIENLDDLTEWSLHLQELAETATALRALASFYEANPTLELPTLDRILNYVGCADSPKQAMAEHIRAGLAAGLKVDKAYDQSYGNVKIHFGGGLHLEVYAGREQVCERVVTGTREVSKTVPDPDALAAVPTVTVTETVEDVEWVCSPLLADAAVRA